MRRDLLVMALAAIPPDASATTDAPVVALDRVASGGNDPLPSRGLSSAEIDLMNRLFVPPPLPEGHPRNRHERRQAKAWARARRNRANQ